MREKNDSSPTPRLRAISISGLVSWVYVTIPSIWAGPVGDEPAHEPVGRQDVHEDVGRAPLLGEPGVVMDVLVVARRDCGRHDERARQRDDERRDLVTDLHVVVAERRALLRLHGRV